MLIFTPTHAVGKMLALSYFLKPQHQRRPKIGNSNKSLGSIPKRTSDKKD